MAIRLSESFVAKAKALDELLYNGLNLYIPAYQREYTWRDEDVEKLIWDFVEGIDLLQEKDSFTFIGSLITSPAGIHDIDPAEGGENPGQIDLVIDGQQRLTTILIFCLVLQNLLEVTTSTLESSDIDKTSAEYHWINATKTDIVNLLKGSLYNIKARNGGSVYFPRMIRAYVDMWARDPKISKYESPIAKQLGDFSQIMDNPIVYKPSHPGAGPKEKFRKINRNIQLVQKHFITLAKGFNPENETAFVEANDLDRVFLILNSLGFQTQMISNDGLNSLSSNSKVPFFELIRLLAISKYLLTRVVFSHIDCKDEEYAFSVFQSLNTTGLPLNAIEVLTPQVIRAVGPSHFATSQEYKDLNLVTQYVSDSTSKDTFSLSGSLVIQFALAESGRTVSKSIFDQKAYLQKEFKTISGNDETRRAFIARLRDTVAVDSAFRTSSSLKVPEIKDEQLDQSEMIMSFLKNLNHTIALAPINRFYNEALKASSDTETGQFVDCLWAVASFSCLWRASRETTGQIDSRYRSLMSGTGITDEIGLSYSKSSKPNISDVKKVLNGFLINDGISTKDQFVERAKFVNVYRILPVARMLFLAAHQDSVHDELKPGQIRHAGKKLVLKYVSLDTWKSRDFLTIEHIAPQTPGGDWTENKLYEDRRLINVLGNILLVSQSLNSSFGNRDWKVKRSLYSALSAPDYDTANEILQSLPDELVGVATQELVIKQDEQPQFSSLAKCEDFDTDFVIARTERLLGLAYDYLIKHLI
jgi:hypothetical protein